MSQRISISKSVRFSVFSRDGFTCKYCGRQSDEVKLVLDHIIPVCQGGTNDTANLITSCEACNQGKGGKTIAQAVPTESDRLRILQEYREIAEVAKAQVELREAREDVKQSICNYFCTAHGTQQMEVKTLAVLFRYSEEVGIEELCRWIDLACDHFKQSALDEDVGKYISGIRRRLKEQNPAAPPHQPCS